MRAASRTKSEGLGKEQGFVDALQNAFARFLHDLVLHARDRKRARGAIHLGNLHDARRARHVSPSPNPDEEVREILLDVLAISLFRDPIDANGLASIKAPVALPQQLKINDVPKVVEHAPLVRAGLHFYAGEFRARRLVHCAVLAHVVSPVPLADYWSPSLHGRYPLPRYYGSSAILRPIGLPSGFTPCGLRWAPCLGPRTSRVDCLFSLRMPGSQTPPGEGRTHDNALSPVGFRNAKFVAPRDSNLSRLNHFTLARSGLRSSLHTLYALPLERAHNACYIMGRYSFDGGDSHPQDQAPFPRRTSVLYLPFSEGTPLKTASRGPPAWSVRQSPPHSRMEGTVLTLFAISHFLTIPT